MFRHQFCLVAGHAINRKRVWHDGLDFRTKCSRCGQPLVRSEHGWRAFIESEDEDPRRRIQHKSA